DSDVRGNPARRLQKSDLPRSLLQRATRPIQGRETACYRSGGSTSGFKSAGTSSEHKGAARPMGRGYEPVRNVPYGPDFRSSSPRPAQSNRGSVSTFFD